MLMHSHVFSGCGYYWPCSHVLLLNSNTLVFQWKCLWASSTSEWIIIVGSLCNTANRFCTSHTTVICELSLMVSQFDVRVFRQSYKKPLIIYYEGRLKTSAQEFCWQSTIFNWKRSNHKELDLHLHYISPPISLKTWWWLNITSRFLYVLTLNRQHIIRSFLEPMLLLAKYFVVSYVTAYFYATCRLLSAGKPASIRSARSGYRLRRRQKRQKGGKRRPKARPSNTGEPGVWHPSMK